MRSKRTIQLIIIGLAVFQMLFVTAAVPVHTLTSYNVSIDRLNELNKMGADAIIYVGQEILIQPPAPATATPENTPSTTKVSQAATIQRVIETNTLSLIETQEETRGSDMDLYFLLLFAAFGIWLILVVIGIQRR